MIGYDIGHLYQVKVVTKTANNYTITNVLLEHCSSCTHYAFNPELAIAKIARCLCVDCVKSASIFLCYPCGLTKLKAERRRICVSRAKDILI